VNFTYDILPERRLIRQRFAGSTSLADVRAALRRLWADPLYSKNYDGIVDLSATTVGISMEDLRALIGFLQESDQMSTGRWGAVVSSPLTTACAMIYQRALAPRHEFEVFATWEAACGFLGVELAPLPASVA
jgi:hypothetical protein